MKVLSNLTAGSVTETSERPRNITQALQEEPSPGFFRLVTLGERGVVVQHGPTAVCIPLAEIGALAERAEPDLAGPHETTESNATT